MANFSVSVLTVTYNRAHVLHRVYESLNRQKTRDFEWVVVDDGSTDDTPALLARWQAEADFSITWFRYSNNRGKPAAINAGRTIVSGDYTLMLDSDDALIDDAMETIAAWRTKTNIDTIPDAGILAFRCLDELGNTVGRLKNGNSHFDQSPIIMHGRKARYELGINFECALVYKTKVFFETSALELDNLEHVPARVWEPILECYEVIYIDFPIRIYYRHDGVARLSDSLSKRVKWPRGRYLRALFVLNHENAYFLKDPKAFLNAARKVTRLGLHLGRSPRRQFRDLANGRARLLWLAGMPGGCFGYLRDRLRGRTAPKADRNIAAWGPAAPPEKPELHPPPGRFQK
ncbi:MAG: glycosyltransferase family A protein [Rhodospirillaceae bacterium]|nr:glycosyltransferase family A protein [Rhodospirillaceae bacterium]